MSEPENEKGFSLFSSKTLSFISSLIALTSIIFGGFSTVSNEFAKVNRLVDDYKVVNVQLAKLNDQLGDMNNQMNSLKIATARIEERINIKDKGSNR
jgi:outer membrane murein-binding lipoprotein Lpp